MINEAYFSVTGYVATEPKFGFTRGGVPTLTMRIGWTPRRRDAATGDWADQPSSFASVTCFRKVAENAAGCLRKGDPIVLKGTLRIREFEDQAGAKRTSADVVADSIGHDLSRGTSAFTKSRGQVARTAMERYRDESLTDGRPQPDDGSAPADPDAEASADSRPLDLAAGDVALGQSDPNRDVADQAGLDEADRRLDDDESFDEDEAVDVLAEPEPVGAQT